MIAKFAASSEDVDLTDIHNKLMAVLERMKERMTEPQEVYEECMKVKADFEDTKEVFETTAFFYRMTHSNFMLSYRKAKEAAA